MPKCQGFVTIGLFLRPTPIGVGRRVAAITKEAGCYDHKAKLKEGTQCLNFGDDFVESRHYFSFARFPKYSKGSDRLHGLVIDLITPFTIKIVTS